VYLYLNGLKRQGRVEVANHAGSPEQDAFNGYLDSCEVVYSYKHPCLFTITVEKRVATQSPSPSPQQDVSQWHLPAADVRGDGKYMFKLHTVDLYFWTTEDAELFLESMKRVLAPGQLKILDANSTHPEHRDSMSPVVQQLEKAAIAQPPSAPGAQQRNSVSTTPTAASVNVPAPAVALAPVAVHASANVPGAPSAPFAHTPVSPAVSPPVAATSPPIQQFTPMAYNPAAPPAPEPIAHREKTPPPPDAEAGTGLTSAVAYDSGVPQPHQQQYMATTPQQSFGPQITSGGYMPGFTPVQQGVPGPPSMPPPPPAPGIQRMNTLTSVPSPTVSSAAQSPQTGAPGTFAPPPPPPGQQSPHQVQGQDPQQALYAQQQQLAAQQAALMQQQQQLAQQAQQFQPQLLRQNSLGYPAYTAQAQQAYPQYGYQQQQQQQQLTPSGQPTFVPTQASYASPATPNYGVNHALHTQVYVPEGQKAPAAQGGGQAAATGKLEQKMENADKGINRFFKKLEKKSIF
jgi:hypothetical protein